MVATCLLCQIKIHEPKQYQIVDHYKICSKNIPFEYVPNDHITDESNELTYIYESSVTQRELNGQRKVNNGISAPGFLIKLVSTSKGLERSSECQICKKSKAKPSQSYFACHRLVFYHQFNELNELTFD